MTVKKRAVKRLKPRVRPPEALRWCGSVPLSSASFRQAVQDCIVLVNDKCHIICLLPVLIRMSESDVPVHAKPGSDSGSDSDSHVVYHLEPLLRLPRVLPFLFCLDPVKNHCMFSIIAFFAPNVHRSDSDIPERFH